MTDTEEFPSCGETGRGIMHSMDFKYVRIQGKELAKNTMYAKGIFSMC